MSRLLRSQKPRHFGPQLILDVMRRESLALVCTLCASCAAHNDFSRSSVQVELCRRTPSVSGEWEKLTTVPVEAVEMRRAAFPKGFGIDQDAPPPPELWFIDESNAYLICYPGDIPSGCGQMAKVVHNEKNSWLSDYNVVMLCH